LSGGQRQRIGIARALYRKTDFLFLDEATSALDNTTERALLASLNTEAADMTLFLIAHRLSSVMSCDQIIVMNDGELVGVGDWESLMRENSYFRDLVKSKEQ
jgi:ATP-binding cassette subfamily B protein